VCYLHSFARCALGMHAWYCECGAGIAIRRCICAGLVVAVSSLQGAVGAIACDKERVGRLPVKGGPDVRCVSSLCMYALVARCVVGRA
jgi:hypothetical protein